MLKPLSWRSPMGLGTLCPLLWPRRPTGVPCRLAPRLLGGRGLAGGVYFIRLLLYTQNTKNPLEFGTMGHVSYVRKQRFLRWNLDLRQRKSILKSCWKGESITPRFCPSSCVPCLHLYPGQEGLKGSGAAGVTE